MANGLQCRDDCNSPPRRTTAMGQRRPRLSPVSVRCTRLLYLNKRTTRHDPTVRQRVTPSVDTLVSRSAGGRRLVGPEIPKSIRRQRRVPGRRLQVPMPEVMRQRPGVLAIVRQLVAGRMPQHVWMHSESESRRAAGALDHPQEPSRCYWRSGFGHEHIRARPLQRSQGSKLRPMQGMNTSAAALRAVHMQAALSKIDLRPAKATKLRRAEAMPIGQQDCTSIPSAIAASLARSVDQPFDLGLGQILTRSVAGCAYRKLKPSQK